MDKRSYTNSNRGIHHIIFLIKSRYNLKKSPDTPKISSLPPMTPLSVLYNTQTTLILSLGSADRVSAFAM